MTTPINTALLSYGMSGEVFHAPLIAAHPRFLLHTIVQRKSRHAAARYPQVTIVDNVDKVFADSAIELIVVNTPNDTHVEFVTRALEAGKHVIVEKPFTVTTAEADQLIALAKRHNKILTVFQSRRFDGDFMTLKKVVAANLVGKIAEIEVHYDRFRNYIEANTWKEESGRGTGILYNLGSHMLDQVINLVGNPSEVDARIGIQRPNGKVDDYYDIRLYYKGFHVIVKSSYLVREQGPRYTIHGTEGSFVKYGIDPQEQALKEGKIPGSAGWGVEDKLYWGKLNSTVQGVHVEGTIETVAGNYLAFYQNVFEAIRENKPLAVKPEESREVIRLIEACYESNRKRQAVNF
ncbi:MAG TPA: Gfo/Idh/MocA family oxidoreductase [Ohtaekwangia sp.]|uniref:Gfo/Idh/MocA family oxidoreductase n=1 Tax=Ohtaekwangia sp. TaxID=2066019 RepID=UPI002F931553